MSIEWGANEGRLIQVKRDRERLADTCREP